MPICSISKHIKTQHQATMNSPTIKHISECFIKPKYEVETSKPPYYLSPWDLLFLTTNYAEHGFLFNKPKQTDSIHNILKGLKESLALALVHFYPFAGQLVTDIDEQNHRCLIYVDCNKGPGVGFTHATLDLTISDLLSATYIQPFVKHLFDHDDEQINYDGHTKPLLSVKVTEFVDGIFLGLTTNHMIADGIGHWKFLNYWSDIYQANCKPIPISKPPILKRYIPNGYTLNDLYLPYTHPDELITRYEPPPLEQRFFYLSSNAVQNLKIKANEENNNQFKISSLQAVLALLWRSFIRAKGLPANQVTNLRITANERSNVNSPLPDEYFGNAVSRIPITTTVGELMENGFGWTAQLVNKSVMAHHKKDVNDFFQTWYKSPFVFKYSASLDAGTNSNLQVGSSPRSDVYHNQFGPLGKPIAIRTGNANKFDGKVYAHPGLEGGSSMELDISLSPQTMAALESDEDFMGFVSSSPWRKFLSRQICEKKAFN